MLKPGLYEQIVNEEIIKELKDIPDNQKDVEEIDSEEASIVLSKYIRDVVQKGLNTLKDSGKGISSQIELTNKIVSLITEKTDRDFDNLLVDEKGIQLKAYLEDKDSRLSTKNAKAKDLPRPETSIAQSSLFTGATQEPQMASELNKEIGSANRIDMLVSFIRWSGLRLIIDALQEFTLSGGKLRVITTPYMGATDLKAITELSKLTNTEIKITYDTTHTRLHAKTYVFYRDTGFTTAYIGSSNVSNAALSSGLEWNVKITKTDLPETVNKVEATFESYWNSPEYETYTEEQEERLLEALNQAKGPYGNKTYSLAFEMRPFPFQEEILGQLQAERDIRQHYKNLLVAATGTGKTVISAFDYKRFRQNCPGGDCSLLFIAHREEILKQSVDTFRVVLGDLNFGELAVGNFRHRNAKHLFMSIQTLNAQDFTTKTNPNYYDFIIIDEFHHAKAPSYQKILSYYKPKILLGLTATPERMDGQNILDYFDGRIAAEIRLPEAIERKLLCPFQYFGVTDSADLDSLKWVNGGYDKRELSNLYSLSTEAAFRRAELIRASVIKYVTDVNKVTGLGFCVSVEHAKFMSSYFNEHGIPSSFLVGTSTPEERVSIQNQLVKGEIKFLFVVDIYNEGVDIPQVNTILLLRPTESLTIFLQQLGRGLRLSEGKECLTVLDFIGQANQKYNFETKFASLLANTNKSVMKEIKDGFINVPKGCYIKLEKIAAEHILKNIKESFGTPNALCSRVKTFEEDTSLKLNIKNFIDYYRLDAREIYKRMSFSRLMVRAGVKEDFISTNEDLYTKALARFLFIDSKRWIKFLLRVLPNLPSIDISHLNDGEQRMMQMFYATFYTEGASNWKDIKVQDNIRAIYSNKTLFNELIELLEYRLEKIDFLDKRIHFEDDIPLDLYCSYSRDQILVALDFMNPSTVREGVKWLADKKTDVFFVTLNKSDKDYSPSTMYNDYSINERLFHWQSQSTTSESSTTGQRYINHKKKGTTVLLFVREFKKDKVLGTAPTYTFLGKANYLMHTGSSPMNITWSLEEPIPARFIKKTNRLVVG